MEYTDAIGIIAISFAVTAMATRLSARAFSYQFREKLHEIGIPVFLQLGVVFAVLLAFVFNQVWEQFNAAQNAVDKECVDLQGAANRSAFLPPATATRVRAALKIYLQAEIDDEWPLMARRQISNITTKAYTDLFAEVATISPTTPLIAASRDNILRLISDVRDQRQLRLFQLSSNVPGFLWALLSSFGVVLTLFVMLSAIIHVNVHAIITGIFAVFMVSTMLTIHLLDYPFEGSIRISSEPLSVALQNVDMMPINLGAS